MNRTTTALLAALDAVIVVAIGIGIALVPLTVLWAVQFNLAIDWTTFWRAAADVWLVGNGTDLTVALGKATATSLALPGADAPFQLTIAALGFAMLAMLLGIRTGMRTAETPYRSVGVASAVVVYGVLSAAIAISAASAVVSPSLAQGIFLPTAVYGVSVLIGSEIGLARDGTEPADAAGRAIRATIARLSPAMRAGIAAALRAGTAAAAAVLVIAAILVAVMLVLSYGRVIGLYEGLQAGALGAAVLTIAQLALLPNLVVWAASWLVGPGFAIGAGSSVSALGTQLGPIPPLPLFGILPQGGLAFGFIGIAVPVLAGFLAAVLVRASLARTSVVHREAGRLLMVGAGIGVVAGIVLGLLAWWSAGALGPGRLHDVGPNPLLVGAIAAAEIGCAAMVGMFAGTRAKPYRGSVGS